MADFLKCCFPSARRAEDDEIELVSKPAAPGSRRARYNTALKTNISRPMPHYPEPVKLSTAGRRNNPYPHLRRRPSEDLQDLVDDDGEQASEDSSIVFNHRDRAHGHVLRDLHAILQHSKWAVSGSYAEALWACPRSKRRDIVSIICQSSSRSTTKAWLMSQSLFTISKTHENVLEYRGDTAGAAPVSVRIRWVSDRELERLGSVEGTFKYREAPSAPVEIISFVLLTLPALADNLALSWVKAADQRVKNDFADDLFAVLERIVQLDFAILGTGPLNAGDNVHVMHKSFWLPFTAAYPHAPTLFAQCGLPIPDSGRIITAQPPQQVMKLSLSPLLPFERPNSFDTPRSAPVPPALAAHGYGRNLTKLTPREQSSSAKPPASSKPPLPAQAGRPSLLSKDGQSSAKSRPVLRLTTEKLPAAVKKHKYIGPQNPEPPLPSPPRPVHPANIIPPAPEPRSKLAALLGLGDSAETIERRRKEKLEEMREAQRAADKLAALIQRNRERERERQWHTRKQAERMAAAARDRA